MTGNGGSTPGRRRRRTPPTWRARLVAATASSLVLATAIGADAGLFPGVPDATTASVSTEAAWLTAQQAGQELRSRGEARASRSRANPSSPDAGSPAPDGDGVRTPSPTPSTTPAPTSTSPATPEHIPENASGDLATVPGVARAAVAAERVITYQVEVEKGLPFDRDEVADTVHGILSDERGWRGVHDIAFERTDADAELRIIVASPDLTDSLCAPLDTGGEVSCRIGERVVLNAERWAYGVPDYEGDLTGYRTYLVYHETGHALGYGHAECPGPGEPAPVMMQQTKGVGACEPNPWPVVSVN